MIKAWLASAAVGAMTLFGASSTGDHKPPRMEGREKATSTMMERQGEREMNRMGSSTTKTIDVACVAAAVSAREVTLQAGITTLTGDTNTAYITRATALASAYTQTGNDAIKAAVKTTWQQFGAALKIAKKNWQKSRDDAWKTFKTAVKSCGGSAFQISDSNNSSLEASGQ